MDAPLSTGELKALTDVLASGGNVAMIVILYVIMRVRKAVTEYFSGINTTMENIAKYSKEIEIAAKSLNEDVVILRTELSIIRKSDR